MSIPNDIIGSANVSYLGDPFEQYCGLNGKPLIGGHIEVYLAGTSDKYMTLQDFDGDYNPFKVPLGADGRVVMLADPSLTYDIYIYNSYNDLVCSRLNVECTCPGTINLSGADTWVRNTDGTLDISLRTSANNRRVFDVNTRNKLLDVQSPLYFVENSETATVIGFSGDDYASKEYVDSAVSSKLDTTAFSNVSGDFLTDKFEYDDDNHITAYNHSAFAGGGGSGPNYEAGDHIDITDNVISVTGLPDSADLENAVNSAVEEVENKFEYNTNNYITAYNNSAFAGKEYSAGDGISIVNNVISVTSQGGGIEQVSHDDTLSGNGNSTPLGIANVEDFVKQNDLTAYQPVGDYYSASNPSGFITNDALTGLQPAGDYATKTELESATSGKMDVTGMTAYQPTGDYATHDDLTAYQPVGDYYSASNPSGFITNDAITGLQPSGDYATHDDLTAYATTAELANKLDTTAFSDVSGSFLTAVPAGTMNEGNFSYDADDNITAYNGSAFNAGAGGLTVCAFSALSSNFGAFRNTIKDNPEQYAVSFTSGNNIRIAYFYSSGAYAGPDPVYPTVTEYSDWYTYRIADNTETSSFDITHSYKDFGGITGQETTQAGMSTSTVGAGGELPESVSAATDYVTATSADINATIDNVSANSGAWGGSALPISAGPGIKFEMVNDTLVASTDETVLWTNNGTLYAVGQTINFNESPSAFEKIEFRCAVDIQSPECLQFEYHPGNLVLSWHELFNGQFRNWFTLLNVQNDGATAVSGQVYFANLGPNSTFTAYSEGPNWEYNFRGIQKIVGIKRIAGGN